VLRIGAAAYSFTRAPALVDAGRNLRSGQGTLARQDYVAGAAQLQRAHDEAPSSRKIAISLAEADFGANRPTGGARASPGHEAHPERVDDPDHDDAAVDPAVFPTHELGRAVFFFPGWLVVVHEAARIGSSATSRTLRSTR
jgi:hypothetical protein